MQPHEIYEELNKFGIDADKETRHDRVLLECLNVLKQQRGRIGELLAANNDYLERSRLAAKFEHLKDKAFAIIHDPENQTGKMGDFAWLGVFQKPPEYKESHEIFADSVTELVDLAIQAKEDKAI